MTKKALEYTGSGLLILCAAFCTLGVLISAFDIEISIGRLLPILLIATAAFVIPAAFYRGTGILIALVPAALLAVWNFAAVTEGFTQAVHIITLRYNVWLPVPVLFSASEEYAGESLFAFLSAAGVAVIVLLTITIYLKRSALLTALVTLPVVFISFVLVETQADAVYLLGLMAVYLALIFGSALYYEDHAKNSLILTVSFVLSLILLCILYIAAPPGQYVRSRHAETMRGYISGIPDRVMDLFPGESNDNRSVNGWYKPAESGMWQFNTDTVNAADSGPRVITDRNLLEVRTSRPGTFYLKGFTMREFDGKAWVQNPGRTGMTRVMEAAADETPALIAATYSYLYSALPETAQFPVPQNIGMNIQRIDDVTDVAYTPYYSGSSYADGNDIAALADYDMAFYYAPGSILSYASDVSHLLYQPEFEDYDAYLQIDGKTAEGLRQLADDAGIDFSLERGEAADAVAEYIRSAAVYSLAPQATPEGEDFALYFLQTSREGYCIHFATAAALMLRALDIPARFACGFTARVPSSAAGNHAILTDRNAHAWVEVLYDGIGWLPLEVTPPAPGSEIPAAARHAPAREIPEAAAPSQPASLPSDLPDQIAQTARQAATQNTNTGQSFVDLLINFLYFACFVILSILLLILRRYILSKVRGRRFLQEDTNAAIIQMWRYAKKMGRGNVVIPTDIEDLALKARFSRHRMTEDERQYMLTYTRRLALEIYEGKEIGRLWFRYIRGFG